MPQTSERERLSRLLIVEDEPSQLRTLTSIMEKEGFEVIGASTGVEALENIEREDFGVAVVDLRLPDIPGTQLLEKINARNPNIRIIINTGYSSFDSAKEAVNLGAFAYVEKAGNPEELVRRVHDASRWHLERYATDLEDAVAARTSELRRSNDALKSEIAERQRGEVALHESEERYRALAENNPHGIQAIDRTGIITYVNRAYVEMLGYTEEELLGKNILDLVEPASKRPELRDYLSLLVKEEPAPTTYFQQNRRKDGEVIEQEVSWNYNRDGERNVVGFISVITDISERKRIEEELRESSDLLKAVHEANPDLQFVLDPDGTIASYHARDDMDLYVSPETFIGQKMQEVLPAKPAEQFLAAFDTAAANGSLVTIEYTLPMPDGERSYEGRIVPLPNRRLVVTVRDITERQQAEEKLRKLSAAVEQSPSMVLITDIQGAIEYVNPKFTEVTGYSLPEIVGKNPRILKSGEKTPENYKELWDTVIAGGEWRGEFHNKKKNGELYWESASISGVRNADGIITHFLAVKEDITKRKQVAEALEEREHHFRLFALSTGDCFWNWDMVAGTVERSSGFERSFGYPEQEMLPGIEWWSERIHPEDREHVLKAFDAAVAGGQSICGYEYRFRCRDGSFAVVDDHVCLVRDDTGKVVRSLGAMQDITKRKQAEEQRILLLEQLHHSQKMEAIGQLAGGMTHNFNNLLQVISANIEVLRKSLGDCSPTAHKTLTLANEACEQAVELARSLLTFSRRTTTEKQTVDLRSIVQSAVRLLDRTLPATVQLVLGEGGDVPVWIDGDQAQLQQVLINLAINARDAMPDGGTLTISVEQIDGSGQQELADSPGLEDRFARLVVADTGTGMSPDVQARIFEPFFTTKPHEEGTGLGLSIVHGVVEEHGGQVEVHSEIGAGSTFTIFLPCVHPASKEVMVEPSLDAPQGHGELILLAAGDRQVRAIVAANLTSTGYEVLQADDGPAVLECADLHGSTIQLFVLEQGLAEHTGIECLQQIRAAGLGTPAIILSDAEQEHLEEQLDNDTALLRKPFLLQELGRLVADRLAPAKRAGPSLQEESVS